MTALHENTVSHLRSSITNDAAASEVQTLLERINGGGDGAVPSALADYVTVVEHGDGALHRTELTITDLPLAIVFGDDTVGGHGTEVLYDFPEGQIKILGGHMNLTELAAGAGGIDDDAVLDVGIGSATVAATDATLATTEQNIVAKADVTLSSGASTAASITSADVTINGSSTAIDANLNVAVAADDLDDDDTLTVSGLVTLHWLNLGDG